VVIDVGAFVGGTAMYFILKGTGRVITIEPLPANYEELLDNIHLNGIERRIIPINAIISNRRMIMEIPTNVPIYIRGGSIGDFRRHGVGNYVNIESITINDIIDRFGINPNDAVLKMGCEYDVILNDYEHVKLFEEVVFEYHAYAVHRPIAEPINTMSNDFNCQTINEDFFRKFFSNYSRDQLGLIRCVKRS